MRALRVICLLGAVALFAAPGPGLAARPTSRPDIVNGLCIAAMNGRATELDELAASLGGRATAAYRTESAQGPLNSRPVMFPDGSVATFSWNDAQTHSLCVAILEGVTPADLAAREFKVQSGYDGWGHAMPWAVNPNICAAGERFLRTTDVSNEGLCASVSPVMASHRRATTVVIRHVLAPPAQRQRR